MKERWFVAALLAIASAAVAQGEPDVNKIISDDKNRWSAMRTESDTYRAPPASWHIVTDPAFEVSISFPCAPNKSLQQGAGSRVVVIYSCADGTRGYVAELQHQNFTDETSRQLFMAGSEYGVVESLQQAGISPRIVPVKRIIYGNAIGRDEDVLSDKLEIHRRCLIKGNSVITLQVNDSPGKVNSERDAFLNTLKMQQLE